MPGLEQMQPTLLSDRIPSALLRDQHPGIYAALIARGLGKLGRAEDQAQGRVQFCGMIRLDDETLAVFLPRACARSLPLARLTMQALSRYGAEAPERRFESDGSWGNSGLLAVIRRLSDDFMRAGLYSERERMPARNVGKPDWGRTIKSLMPVETGAGGATIYPDLVTTRMRDSSAGLISQIQAHVMGEILRQHGWWSPWLEARRALLRGHPRPSARRSLWPSLLRNAQSRLYSTRALDLVRDLIFYLEESRDQASGAMVFGLEDFHHVWETMLRRTLQGVSPGWNTRLPKPVYSSDGGANAEAPQRGMQTDIILENAAGFHIVDAKYYEASSAGTAPGWQDIAKQMFYELALRSVVGAAPPIQNSFVFPGRQAARLEAGGRGLHSVSMQLPNGHRVASFPQIECHYLDPAEVMTAYLGYRQDLTIVARPDCGDAIGVDPEAGSGWALRQRSASE